MRHALIRLSTGCVLYHYGLTQFKVGRTLSALPQPPLTIDATVFVHSTTPSSSASREVCPLIVLWTARISSAIADTSSRSARLSHAICVVQRCVQCWRPPDTGCLLPVLVPVRPSFRTLISDVYSQPLACLSSGRSVSQHSNSSSKECSRVSSQKISAVHGRHREVDQAMSACGGARRPGRHWRSQRHAWRPSILSPGPVTAMRRPLELRMRAVVRDASELAGSERIPHLLSFDHDCAL